MDRPHASRPPVLDVLLALGLAAVGWWEVLVDAARRGRRRRARSGSTSWPSRPARSRWPSGGRRRSSSRSRCTACSPAARPGRRTPSSSTRRSWRPSWRPTRSPPTRRCATPCSPAVFSALALAVLVVRGSGTDAAPAPLATAVLFGTVWLVGRVVGVRNERARELHEARDEHAADAVAAERERIARELHDAVSHSLAAIVMQAGGARHVLATDPEPGRDEPGRDRADGAARARGDATDARAARGGGGPGARSRASTGSTSWSPGSATAGSTSDPDHRRARSGADRGRRVGVPHRAGGADQRDQARRRPAVPRSWSPGAEDALEVVVADDGAGDAAGRAVGADGRGIAGMRERVARARRHLRGGTRAPGRGFRVRGEAAAVSPAVRVLLVDDQELVRAGLDMLLDGRAGRRGRRPGRRRRRGGAAGRRAARPTWC